MKMRQTENMCERACKNDNIPNYLTLETGIFFCVVEWKELTIPCLSENFSEGRMKRKGCEHTQKKTMRIRETEGRSRQNSNKKFKTHALFIVIDMN